MSRQTRLSRFLMLTVVILLVVGCAVTKIDVDVYKGPLANHKDVQMQQMSVMAIGAKPLLIQLRDRLEVRARGEKRSLRDILGTDYEDRFIRPLPDGGLVLKDDNAIRVNAVLSLYEDRHAGDPNDLYERAQAALADYTRNWAIFWGGSPAEWQRQWAELAQGLHPPSKQRKPLIQAFRKFFVPEKGDYYRHPTEQIYEAWPNPIDSAARNRADRDAEPEPPGANASFLTLSKPSVVEEYAGRLFPDDVPQKARFVRDVTSIAKAFLGARDALRRMLRINLTRLMLLEATVVSVAPSAEAKKEAEEAKEAMIELVVTLTRRRHFRAVMQAVQGKPECFSDDLIGLQGAVTERERRDTDFLNAEDVTKYTDFLKDRLGRETSRTASALLEADGAFARKDFPTDRLTGRCRDFIDPCTRRFGLTWIPAVYDNGRTELLDQIRPENLARQQGKTRWAGTAGFARGRLDPGLETLIEEYLETVHHGSSSAASLSEAKKECLLEALVRFATKVLFIADNSTLLSATSGSAPKDIEEYVLVLQAVGNSILVQADELRHLRTHHDKASDKATTEQHALKGTLSQDPVAVFRTLIAELKARRKRSAARLAGLAKRKKDAIATEKELQDLLAVLADPDKTPALKGAQFCDDKAKITLDGRDYSLKQAKDVLDDLKALVLVGKVFFTKSQSETFFTWEEFAKEYFSGEQLPDPNKDKSAVESCEWFSEALGNAIDRERKKASPTVPELESCLVAAKSYIDGLPETEIEERADDKPTKLFDALMHFFSRDWKKRQQLATAVEWLRKKDKLLVVQKTLGGLTEQEKKVQKEHGLISNAVEKIGAAKCKVLDELGTCKGDLPTAALLAHLDRVLRSMKKTADQDRAKYDDALAVLGEIPVPTVPGSVFCREAESDEEVMDRLMATLRHEHIQAVHMYGEDSPTAERIKAALTAAATHRSGMAYIRPPSAYLRSSYPAASLQSDPGLAWDNMLLEQGFRSVWDISRPSKTRRKITAEIDKQFWQNINSVRVSGGGRTNYVIAKDDIGNWYVKAYSADPQDIIKSAQNLALYNMGAAMGTDLLPRLDPNYVSEDAQGDKQSGSWQQQGFEAFRDNYHTRTDKDHEALKKLSEGLHKSIETGWEANGLKVASEIKGILTAPQARLTAFTEKLKDEPPEEPLGQTVIDQLRELMHFERSVNAALRVRIDNLRSEIEAKRRTFEQTEAQATRLEGDLAAARVNQSDIQRNLIKAQDLRDRLRNSLPAGDEAHTEVDAIVDELRQKKLEVDARVSALEEDVEGMRGPRQTARKAYEDIREQNEPKIATATAAREVVTDIVMSDVKRFAEKRHTMVTDYIAAIEILGGKTPK